MTNKPAFKLALILLLVVMASIGFDLKFFHGATVQFLPAIFSRPLAYSFGFISKISAYAGTLNKWGALVSENERLKSEIFDLRSQLGREQDLVSENDFLRKSLKLPQRLIQNIAYADIFNFQSNPNGYQVLLTKGAADGISTGDTVITQDGVLVGSIRKAYASFSSVLIVLDPEFKATARVLSGTTQGIAQGVSQNGLRFDMIIQSDDIKEGDTVVTNGTDLYPAGLVIGSVDHVDSNDTQLYKNVRIKPAIDEIKLGRVLVIKKQ